MTKKTFLLYVLRDLIIAMLFGLGMISTAEVSLTGYYKLLGYIAFIVIAMITSGSFRQTIGKIILAFLGFAFISFVLMSIFLSVESVYGKNTAMIIVFGPVIYLVYFKKWHK